MKPQTNRFYTPLGLLLFFLLCLVPNGNAQTGQPVSYLASPAQLALNWTFTSSSPSTSAFTVSGLRYFQFYFVPNGTVSGCSISLDSSAGSGFTTGGILSSGTIGSCASAAAFSSSATTPTLLGQLTPSITGSGSVTVILLGYVNNPGAAGSSSAAITSPVDGSGFVEVNCKTGCAGGNANGQALMAASAPVVIASNQSTLATQDAASSATGSAVPAKAVFVGGSNAGNEVGLHVDSLGDLDVNLENSVPAGANTIGAVTQASGPWTANITQVGGSAVATGTGASGAGIPRVTVSNDSSLAANQSVNVNEVGGTVVVADPCQANVGSPAVINLTASGQVIAGTASKQTYICALDIVTATAQNIALVEGTGTTCAVGTAGMAGGSTAATGWNFAATSGLVKGNGAAWVYKTATTADNICILLSSTGQTSGSIRYVQQ